MHYPHSLVIDFDIHKRCAKCDALLSTSVYNGIPIVSTINKGKRVFECIQCSFSRMINGERWERANKDKIISEFLIDQGIKIPNEITV